MTDPLLRRRWWLGLAATLALVTLPFLEVLLGTRTIMWGDVTGFHLPRFVAAWSNIGDGRSPFWWNGMFSGFNMLGAGPSAIFYPLNAIFGWLNPAAAFRVWFFAHLWLMAGGWFVWSWRRWHSIPASVLTGVVGSINGYFAYHSLNPSFAPLLMLLPWMFVLLDRIADHERWRDVALLALLVGLATTVGFPQLLVYGLLALGLVTVFRLVRARRGLRAWMQPAMAVGLGLALGALQLIPQSRFSASSVRPSLDKAAAFEFSAEPRHLLTLVAPHLLGGGRGFGWNSAWIGGSAQHEVAGYLGIGALALAIIGSITLGRRHRLNLALVVLAVFGLLVSLGGRTPIGTLTYHVVPFADHFRAWARFELFANLAVTMLCGGGLVTVLEAPRRWAPRLMASGLGVLLALSLLVVPARARRSLLSGSSGFAARLVPALLLLALGAAVLMLTRSRRAGSALIVVLCAADLAAFTFMSPWRSRSFSPSEAAALFDSSPPFFCSFADRPGGVDRWLSEEAQVWNVALAKPIEAANGYDALAQADYTTAAANMAYNGFPSDPGFWSPGWLSDVLRVTTLSLRYYQPTDPAWRPVGAPVPALGWSFQRYERTPRLAEAYLVGEAVVSTADAARAALRAPNSDPQRSAFVDVASIPARDTPTFVALSAPGASGTVLGGMNDDGTGTWTVDAARPSLFVASWAWMDGWTATVDGQRAPVARTNGLVLGVPVPAGQHTVHLHFTPPGWHTGRNISILALLVLIGLLFYDWSLVRLQRARGLGHGPHSGTTGEQATEHERADAVGATGDHSGSTA